MKKSTWNDLDIEKVINYAENLHGKIILGIDGFIDQVWQVVETRLSSSEYILIDKMKKFGELIVNRGNGGMANEIISKRRSCGGFTANTGKALCNLDLNPVMLAMYGKDRIDPIFDEFYEKCTVLSVGDPVISNVLEFTDGKIMMPHLNDLLSFQWSDLVSSLGHRALSERFKDADIVSLGYWSNMPKFDEIITEINNNFFKEKCPKRMFFDFANIKKRSVEAINDTFLLLGDLNNKIPMTLSLNEHEAALLFSYYDEAISEDVEGVGETAFSIRERLNLDEIIIHTQHYAVAASASEGIGISIQDYCENPVITTGAGDTFNGGYIATCLGKLNINERLAVANATTRFYVMNGFPPSREQLIEEIKGIKKRLSC